MSWISLNVGGVNFETTTNTLNNIPYFRVLIERWKNIDDIIRVDRSGILFEHVLNYVRDYNYPYPLDQLSELDFYCIDYDNLKEKKNIADNLIRDNQKKLDICFNYLKNYTKLCSMGYCTNNHYDGFKYCFSCKPPQHILYRPVADIIRFLYYNTRNAVGYATAKHEGGCWYYVTFFDTGNTIHVSTQDNGFHKVIQ